MKPIHVILYTLLTLFALAVLGVFLLFLVIWSFSDTTPTVHNNSTLVISLSGDIPEYHAEDSFPIQFDSGVSIKSILDNIEKARVDKRIKGILLRINDNYMGWAKKSNSINL